MDSYFLDGFIFPAKSYKNNNSEHYRTRLFLALGKVVSPTVSRVLASHLPYSAHNVPVRLNQGNTQENTSDSYLVYTKCLPNICLYYVLSINMFQANLKKKKKTTSCVECRASTWTSNDKNQVLKSMP